MLKPTHLNERDIWAMDRAYIDYEKFEVRTYPNGVQSILQK